MLFSFLEVHTKTLANQELGHALWLSASLSQGDLCGRALRLDPSEETSLGHRSGARPTPNGWVALHPSAGCRLISSEPEPGVQQLCKTLGAQVKKITQQRARGAVLPGAPISERDLKAELWCIAISSRHQRAGGTSLGGGESHVGFPPDEFCHLDTG